MQNPSKTCPRCQAPIPDDAPGGLCPACVLQGAAQPSEPAALPGVPSREEIAAAFPELEVADLLGRGGMGLVFKARQPRLDREVALKILPPSLARQPGFAERFTREARALARLSHPHIVAVYDFGEQAGFYYLLMEFVNGVNLRQAMRAGVTPEQAMLLVPRICEALQFAHDRGVLHRDIKPENILLDTTGTPKLADFGIAKLAGEPATASGLTATGAQLGTAAYMAPEQIEKPATVDHRADIYSLGVVFYEMLTGELPLGRFAAPSEKANLAHGVDEVVLRALEKERERRQQSATEMKTEVEGVGTQPPAASETSDPLPFTIVTRVLLTLTSLCAVGIPVAAMLHWRTPSPTHMVALTTVLGTLTGMSLAWWAKPGVATKRRKDVGMAYFFWFILGPSGLHKFYLGEVGWGLLYFFTAGLFLVGWIIDLFTLPEQVRRVNAAMEGRSLENAGINPWPRRIFLLIVLLVVVPAMLFTAGLIIPHLAARKQRAPAAELTAPRAQVAAQHPPFVGKLSQGSVELVAISPHPAGATRGWQMNGEQALEGPFVNRGSTSTAATEKETAYEFVFHTRDLPPDASLLDWFIAEGNAAWGGNPELTVEPGKALHDYAVISVTLPRARKAIDLRAGVAAGAWYTLAEYASFHSISSHDYAGQSWQINQGTAVENKEGATVVTYSVSRHAGWHQRVVAVTKDGREVTASFSGRGNDLSEYRFDHLPLASIEHFRFQVRPVEWVLFRDIALAPNSSALEK